MLPDGHKVRQHLAGMAEVRKPVDDGDRGVFGKLLHLFLLEGADHDARAIAGEYAGGVPDGLAAAKLALGGGEEDALAPKLVDARLKGDAGAGGILLKDHGQGLARQDLVLDAVLEVVFELVRQVQDLADIVPAQVQQLQQVVFHFVSSNTFFITARPRSISS